MQGDEYSILYTFPIQESCWLRTFTRTETGGGLGTGCEEDIASSSSVMAEETTGGGWDRGVGGHGEGDVMPFGKDQGVSLLEEDTSFSS